MGCSNQSDEKFQGLPLMFYFCKEKALDLTKSQINIVPAGLQGVDEIRLRDIPFAVAPDFTGKIVYNCGGCESNLISSEDIEKAKTTYQENKEICEAPYRWAGNWAHGYYYNLPANMHFMAIGHQIILDLRQSNVALNRSNLIIGGVKAVLLPTDDETKASRLLNRIHRAQEQRQNS